MSSPEVRTWDDVYDEALRAFEGQLPRAHDEAAVLEVWQQRPLLVERAVRDIAEAVAAGRVRWAWSALAGRLAKGERERDEVAEAGNERADAVAAAEYWLRVAGYHVDRESELVAELFGDDCETAGLKLLGELAEGLAPGHPLRELAAVGLGRHREDGSELIAGPLRAPLREWRGDEALRRRMVELWRELRPRGEAIDADELERAARYRASRGRLLELRRRKLTGIAAAEIVEHQGADDLDLTPIGASA